MFPIQVSFRNFESSEVVKRAIEKHAQKLQKRFDHIEWCRAVVSTPHRHSQQGKIFHVHLQLKVPGKTLNVTHEPEKNHAHEDIYVTIRDAFDALRRELEKYRRKLHKRTELLGHVTPSRGLVIKLFPADGCGFLQNQDGEEVYFHENSVLNEDFQNLSIGDRVRYNEEQGEKGPQASTVALSRKKSPSESIEEWKRPNEKRPNF